MNDLIKIAEELNDLVVNNKILLVKTEPEIDDFTKVFSGKILIYGENKIATISIKEKNEIVNLFFQLNETVFSEEMTVIFWNLKKFVSFFRFHLPKKEIYFKSKIVDLRLVESFLDIKNSSPRSLNEAIKRLIPYLKNELAIKIHNKIHKPLSVNVIPAMENYTGIIDLRINKYVYPSYEIEGQNFGRLNCSKAFENCITPMNMGDDVKDLLKLKSENDIFINFDFKHMEVSMLQYLTKDQALKEAMDEDDDLYKEIYKSIFKQLCDTEEKRNLIKTLFLPIMFGMCSEEGSQISVVRSLIKTNFKTAWEFLEYHQEQSKINPIVKDYFGRPRSFDDKHLKVRGFLIQSASAVFCQEKLICLYNSIDNYGNLVYSIHDGYIVVANKNNADKVIANGLKALQSESYMCEGLQLKVSCYLGSKLNKMIQIK